MNDSNKYIRKLTNDEINNLSSKIFKGWSNYEKEKDEYEFKDNNVIGKIPKDLNGIFIRNGPGLINVYGQELNHPIDGDGLVVTLEFNNGNNCKLKSNFVQSFSHVEERKQKKILYNGQMGTRVKNTTKKKFRDPSHTNAFYFGNKLLALHEYTTPNTLDINTLETKIQSDQLNGALKKVRTLAAHYRYDYENNLLVTASFKSGAPFLGKLPKLHMCEFDEKWNLKFEQYLEIEGLNYVHDFLITPNYYILHITPFVDVSKEGIMKIINNEATPGELMKYYPNLPSKIVLVERYPKQKLPIIKQFNVPPFHIYHFALCYENQTNNTIQFQACCLRPPFNMEFQYKMFLSNVSDAPGVMYNFFIDLNNNKINCHIIDKLKDVSCEFPTTHPYKHCLNSNNIKNKNSEPRYFYLMSGSPGISLPFNCLTKYDAILDKVTRWKFNDAQIGEPCYCPKNTSINDKEDNGYVIIQVYYYNKNQTQFCIFEANDIEKGPITRLICPTNIPYGFHGTFTHQSKL